MLSTTSNVKLEMRFGDYTFDRQIEVESTDKAFSCSGDSGALVYDENDLAVGIVIGGNCFSIERTSLRSIVCCRDSERH